MDADVWPEVVNDAAFTVAFLLARVAVQRQKDGSLQPLTTWQQAHGVVQPTTVKTAHLVDGDETKQAIKLWCGFDLNPTLGDLPQLGDVVEWHGRRYRLVSVEDWSQYRYWHGMAIEVRHG